MKLSDIAVTKHTKLRCGRDNKLVHKRQINNKREHEAGAELSKKECME